MPGEQFFRRHGFFMYDLTNLTGTNGSAIANGNAGLEDLSQNNLDLTIVNAPTVRTITIGGASVNTLNDNLTQCVSLGSSCETAFNRNKFRLYFVIQTSDGIPSAVWNIFGGNNVGLNGFNMSVRTNGKIRFTYTNTDGSFALETDDVVFQNGVSGVFVLLFIMDFDANTVGVRVNGESYNITTVIVGDITTVNPGVGKWNQTVPMYLGSQNNNGTAQSNPNQGSILFAAAIDGNISNLQAHKLNEYLYKRFLKWDLELHIATETDANNLRTTLIASVFNGGGLPTITPTSTTSYTGVMHICNSANLTGFSTITRYAFATNDIDGFTWTNRCYLIETSATSNGNLIINCQGHITDSSTAHESLMNDALAAGYDVLFVALCISSNDNTETNPNITLQSTGGHDQIASTGLDRVGYNALELYLFDKVSAINLLVGNYTDIYMCGISGGGWCTTIMAALDTRIKRAVAVRGYLPRCFKDDVFNLEGDYEQGGSLFKQLRTTSRIYDLYSDISYIDMVLMGTTGARVFHGTSHRTDSCCFKGLSYLYWRQPIRRLAETWGGDFYHYVDTDASRSTHAYSVFDTAEIFKVFDA